MTNTVEAKANDFREDINGLRAWAVVAVLLYHFRVPGFGGGFAGVDVFFVISGFLMTAIVVNGLESDRGFKLWKFYMARVRRIVPALAVLCVGMMLAGWWTLLPIEYKMLGTHAALSLIFLSNFKYFFEINYFDVGAHEKWLLHTWSLSVEWQFYLLLPLFLCLAWKVRSNRKAIVVGTSALAILSLLLCIGLTMIKPSAAFFLLPARAWEMLVGGLAWLATSNLSMMPRARRALELLGYALIAYSVMVFDAFTMWPGWRACIPVAGTVLVILSARRHSLLTGSAIFQWIGFRSYSIYLWHWPVVGTLYYLNLHQNPVAIGSGIAGAMVLGHLSYRYIEIPSQGLSIKMGPASAAGAIAALALVATGMGVILRMQDGFASRIDPVTARIGQETQNFNPRRDECHPFVGGRSPSCVYGGSQLSAIMIGDSHADAVVNALAAAAPSAGDGVMQWTYSACPFLFAVKSSRNPTDGCPEFVAWVMDRLESVPKNVPVVILNRHAQFAKGLNEEAEDKNRPWVYFTKKYPRTEPEFLREYAANIVDTSCHIAKQRPVYLVRPIPEMGIYVANTMARAALVGIGGNVNISWSEYQERQGFIWAAQDLARDKCGVKILDPTAYLCSNGLCHGAHNGRPIYVDDDHLSEFGNRLLVPMFAEVFKDRTQAAVPKK